MLFYISLSSWPNTYLLTYLLTPWSRVLLEKLTGFQLVKKFTVFCGSQRFVTAFTSARHLSLSWTSSIQSTPPHLSSSRPISILSPIYAWVSHVVSFPSRFPTKPCIRLSSPPNALHAPPISFSWTNINALCTMVDSERFSVLGVDHWVQKSGHLCCTAFLSFAFATRLRNSELCYCESCNTVLFNW